MLVELSSGMAAGGVVQNKRLYEVEFEKPFIAETQNFYRLESNHYITNSSCFQYL